MEEKDKIEKREEGKVVGEMERKQGKESQEDRKMDG